MTVHEPLIQVRRISFGYADGVEVHRELDFTLAKGERIGLIGPNGAGKTTLFHLIVGLLRPRAGEIIIGGVTRRVERDFWDVRQRVGLLFQEPDDQLFCPTVGEDVAFGPLNLGKSHDEVREIVARTLSLLSLEHLEARVTHHLSGGEKRLVSLASVLAMGPEALLLDEPAAGLAEGAVARLIEVLNDHVDTCAIISHDRDFLECCTDRLMEMREGRIVAL